MKKKSPRPSSKALQRENEELRTRLAEANTRLAEAEETLEAIRTGAVDALVVSGTEGEQVFALKGAETPYRILVETMHDAALMLDAEGAILYSNHSLAALVQCSPEYPIGKTLADFIRPDQATDLTQFLTQVPAEGRAAEFWLQPQGTMGRPVPVQLAVRPLSRDGLQGLVAVASDLTTQKAYEAVLHRSNEELDARVRARTAELQTSEARYRLLFDRNPDGVFCVDLTGRFTEVNPACEKLSGYSRTELLQKTFFDLCAPDQLARTAEQFRRGLGEPLYAELETALIRKDGTRIELWIAGEPIVENGRGVAMHCTAKDVTARKRAEEVLRQVSRRDAFLVELADALRPLSDAAQIKATAARVLGQHLQASRVAYAELTLEGEIIIEPGYASGVADIPGRYRLDDYGPALLREIRAGRNIVVPDILNAPGYTEEEKARYRAVDVVANLNVPLLKLGRPVALLAVHQATPRRWTEQDVRLAEETVQRTWEAVERGRSEAALIASENLLRSVTDNSADAIYVKDRQSRWLLANPALLKVVGKPLAEVLGRTDAQIYADPAIGAAILANDAQIMERGEPQAFEERAQTPDGIRLFLSVKAPRRDANGQVVGLIGISRDITERKRAEEALGRLAAIVEWSDDAIISKTLDGAIQTWNAGAERIFGYQAQEVIGRPITLLIPPDRMDEEDHILERLRRGEPVEHFETVRLAKDGRRLDVSLTLSPIKDSQGRIIGASKIVRDIADLVRAREVLTRSKQDLERLVAERTAKLQEMVSELEHFSYTITHDMRAPLRAMQGFAEMLAEACVGCERQDTERFLNRIRSSAGRMDSLIVDALNYNRTVRQELPLEPVDAEALLRGMLDTYPELQSSKARIEIKGQIPLVMANQGGLTQCFSNVLGNAVKFVKPGQKPEIRIWAEMRDDSPTSIAPPVGLLASASASSIPASPRPPVSASRVRIWIEDNGIGIPKLMLPRVFDMFSRGHNTYEGTGIGLALVRKVMERMDGKAGAESEEGNGSRFWLELKPAK